MIFSILVTSLVYDFDCFLFGKILYFCTHIISLIALKYEEKLTAASVYGGHFSKTTKNDFDSHHAYDSTKALKYQVELAKKALKPNKLWFEGG